MKTFSSLTVALALLLALLPSAFAGGAPQKYTVTITNDSNETINVHEGQYCHSGTNVTYWHTFSTSDTIIGPKSSKTITFTSQKGHIPNALEFRGTVGTSFKNGFLRFKTQYLPTSHPITFTCTQSHVHSGKKGWSFIHANTQVRR